VEASAAVIALRSLERARSVQQGEQDFGGMTVAQELSPITPREAHGQLHFFYANSHQAC